MWSLVDTVGGMRRRAGRAVPDSSVLFDAKALALNDTVYDSARAYHAGQTVLLNVRSGAWVTLWLGSGATTRNLLWRLKCAK